MEQQKRTLPGAYTERQKAEVHTHTHTHTQTTIKAYNTSTLS
jgi:hypothetical protein